MSQNPDTKKGRHQRYIEVRYGEQVPPKLSAGILTSIRSWNAGIAEFVGQEDAILFSSGFGANAGLLRAILGKNDIAYIDSYIHTSAASGLIGTNVKAYRTQRYRLP